MIDFTFMVFKRTIGLGFIVVFILTVTTPVEAQTSQDQRMLVLKAGMINGFANYTTWPPASRGKPFVIGIVGTNRSLTLALERFFNKKPKSGNVPLLIKNYSIDDPIDCHILIILNEYRPYAAKLLAKIGNRPVLSISDGSEFVKQGGHIGFFSENNKLRFEINYRATVNSQLKVSSRLLGLSRVVDRK